MSPRRRPSAVLGRLRRGEYGLKTCPVCGRRNGSLQRGYMDVCAIGTGCRKGGGTVLGRAR